MFINEKNIKKYYELNKLSRVVAAMLQNILKLEEIPKYLDATDGLAAALCHHYSKGIGENNKTKGNNWSSFIKNNPDRKIR
jgi:crossover junction endodeoxyribonuclease RuvC